MQLFKNVSASILAVVAALLVALLFGAVPAGAAPSAEDGGQATVERIAGDNRYETAAKIALEFPGPIETVVITSGQNFPDALAAASLAANGTFSRDGTPSPVLLTEQAKLSRPTGKALEALKPERIVVVGGFNAVGRVAITAMENYVDEGMISIIAGDDRYDTARLLAERYKQEFGRPETVYLATGLNYPDALAGAAAAAYQGAPMLLTKPGELPGSTRQALAQLRPQNIVVLGGKRAVAKSVLDDTRAYAGNVERIAGDDRYLTAIAISEATFEPARFGGSGVAYVVSGENFPDALAGSGLAGVNEAPVLLTPSDLPTDELFNELDGLEVTDLFLLGGYKAISQRAEHWLRFWAGGWAE